MRLHWGWIEPVMPVPYVPTLGPVHPGDPIPDRFEAVVETAGTSRFLPCDKDCRWSDTKTERVLTDAIEHDPSRKMMAPDGGAQAPTWCFEVRRRESNDGV
ncbi:hypothetical protein ABT124_31540 [Streptomyces sp. NPDC001982]|uniref:hypothetical protein n=1 Tax=unclassified Streptomyces TaxID=2593676 RepID=UPI00331719E2